MLKSMTAFASSEAKIDELTLCCEFRSVNHRYCDISLKLPALFRYTEPDIRSSISSYIKRGKIDCSLSYIKTDNKQKIIINEDAVKALMLATSKIEEHMHTQQSFSALEVLNYPDIQQHAEINKDTCLQQIVTLIETALKQLILSREQEGNQLAHLVEDRCHQVLTLVDSAKKRVPIVLQQLRTKIQTRISELIADPDCDRLEQEMVFLAQKLDVAEELERLEAHVQEVLIILNKNEAVGRRLDFLMQEMNREANTLASKSTDIQMTKIAIDLKVLIEQIREQIQNIE